MTNKSRVVARVHVQPDDAFIFASRLQVMATEHEFTQHPVELLITLEFDKSYDARMFMEMADNNEVEFSCLQVSDPLHLQGEE